MRGSPLWRAIIAFLLIATTGIPLWKLTHRAEATSAAAPVPPAVESKTAQVEFTLTQPASQISIWHLGKRVWSGEALEGKADAELTIPWPAEGVDLRFVIEWPGDARTSAARVQLTAADGTEYDRSIWSPTGPADKVLTFR